MNEKRCIIIPAIKKSAVIPDQLVKKLAGKTLVQRALDTAKEVAPGEDILVVTDSDEIRLICLRNGVGCAYDPAHAIRSLNIVSALEPVLEELSAKYDRLIIYRASSPLITGEDIEDAYGKFSESGSDCLISVKSVQYRFWKDEAMDVRALLDEEGRTAYVETKALVMLRSSIFQDTSGNGGREVKVLPYFLHDRSVEINSYQDWWICEKLLERKHIVFVVAGYPAIGMGHIFRALMFAHEISDHRISFVCTRESELAVSQIAARDYRTKIQGQGEALIDAVLRQRPDVVVNDILNTEADYVQALKQHGCRVVNFEDEGPGAAEADLVVNALYTMPEGRSDSRWLCGFKYFCLRDEFLQAEPNQFRAQPRRLLITFGGTDDSDFTRKTLEALFPECMAAGVFISVVAGPGYAHREALQTYVEECNAEADRKAASGCLQLPLGAGPLVTYTHATNVMSRMMEGVDLAICSAGRTVYELAHMRVPAIVLSHHAREEMHTFARPRNGFFYLGIMNPFDAAAMRHAFTQMMDASFRKELFLRVSRFDFAGNKAHVVHRILGLLPTVEKEYD